jgi:hypothetical protein
VEEVDYFSSSEYFGISTFNIEQKLKYISTNGDAEFNSLAKYAVI